VAPTVRDRFAVFTGLAGMLGTGLFIGLAPASSFSGRWFLLGIGLAAVVCLLVDERPGGFLGDAALAPFLVGRAAAVTAVGGCFGQYVTPTRPALGALGIVVLAVAITVSGVAVPPWVTKAVVGVVLVVLAIVVAACFAITTPQSTGVPIPRGTPGLNNLGGVLSSAGVMVFAFLGFERVGGSRTRSRLAVIVALVIYLGVGYAVVRQLDPIRLAFSPVPLRDAVAVADAASLEPLVDVAVVVTTLAVLLSVLRSAAQELPALPAWSIVCGIGVAGMIGVFLVRPGEAVELAATCALGYFACRSARSARSVMSWLGVGLCVVIAVRMPMVDLSIVVGAVLVGVLVGVVSAWLAPVDRRG
jgi:APA family basic amino acid/polyamine antiporter